MAELFIAALLGHLTGDYLFQSKSMALRKSEPGGAGMRICLLHVLIYSMCVMGFWWFAGWKFHPGFGLVVFSAVYFPHLLIDRISFANTWLKWIGGRTFEDAARSTEKYREFDVAFTCLVYAVVDNTLHLICLWAVIRFLLFNEADV